ncbi:hypothetical protein VUR80DRAFT_6609 [Thermomyces stellatus]
MKGRPVEKLVYEYMFPHPKQTDPANFQALLTRYLIPEVRQEVHSHYGHIDTPEAKYPGLDYTHAVHRIRLSRWPWHRRLFRAFDGLGLTHCEISRFTKWEGTKWAKERYEREQGFPIRDSIIESTPFFVEPRDRLRRLSPTVEEMIGVTPGQLDEVDGSGEEDAEEGEDVDADQESDDAMESVGPTLNERLREQVARREAGDTAAVLDEEWEQWLKNALESGGFPDVAEAISQGQWVDSESLVPTLSVFPPSILRAAREGRWNDVPESLEPTLRRALEAAGVATPTGEDSFWRAAETGQRFRQYYSSLRLPGSSTSLRRTAPAPWS